MPFDDELARRAWPGCERWAARASRSTGVDCLPAANLGLWRAVARYEPRRGRFGPWLRSCLALALRGDPGFKQAMRLRRKGVRVLPISGLRCDPDSIGGRGDDDDGPAIPLGVLTPAEMAVVEAVYGRGMTLATAARELGLSASAAKMRHARALGRLRREMARGR
jgi:hypothetical protein